VHGLGALLHPRGVDAGGIERGREWSDLPMEASMRGSGVGMDPIFYFQPTPEHNHPPALREEGLDISPGASC
jgi:hypothetical protein